MALFNKPCPKCNSKNTKFFRVIKSEKVRISITDFVNETKTERLCKNCKHKYIEIERRRIK